MSEESQQNPAAEPQGVQLDSESTTYRSMLEEVEGLVRTVGSPDIDLDEMVAKIEKGYGLIKTMRARLDGTRKKVELLRDEFEAQDP